MACRTRVAVAWLSLEREQNAPQTFLAYVIMALQRLHPEFGRGILANIQMEEQTALNEGIILLLNELTALPAQVILVLDNYHVMKSRCIQLALKLLLAHLPPNVHMVIASRSEPPGLLTRLRASGQLIN